MAEAVGGNWPAQGAVDGFSHRYSIGRGCESADTVGYYIGAAVVYKTHGYGPRGLSFEQSGAERFIV